MQLSNFLIFIPFISLLCYCTILAIIIGSKKNKIAVHYAYYIIAMIIWSFGSFTMRTSLPPSTIFWNRVLCVGLIGMPVIFYHFTLVLTNTYNKKNILTIGYITALLFIICDFTGLIVKQVHSVNNVIYYSLGPAASIMGIWNLCYLVLSLYIILYSVKSNRIPYKRVKLIVYGLYLVIVGGLLDLLPALGKYPIDFISNTINALFIVFSIYRYRFLEIKLIVKKRISYSLYSLLLSGIYVITIIVIQQLLCRLMNFTSIESFLILAVILAIILQPIKNLIQNWIDSVFYREMLNHQVLLRDFSKIINNELDLNKIADSLLEVLNKGVHPKKSYLFLRMDNEEYDLYNKSQKQYKNNISFSNSHPIVQWFNKSKAPLTLEKVENSSYFACLWDIEKKQLYNLETQIILPIKLRDQLLGIIILSDKKDSESYCQEEMDFLFTLTNNTAIVLENAQMYKDAKKQAITDGLTKLYNHRYFYETIDKFVDEKPYKIFSLAMIDVDMFKLYNDLYGHSTADKALKKIGGVLKQTARKCDFIARYGGDKFIMLLPNVTGIESFKIADGIRKAVEDSFMSSDHFVEFLTISIGIVNYPFDAKSVKELIDCADKAMYIAKRNGKNQCILYSKKDEMSFYINNENEVKEMQDSMTSAYFSAVYALSAAIDAKDHYTYRHSENVSRYAVELAKATGLDSEKVNIVRNAALLHDIGKIGIPENILTKTGSLSDEEFEIMKKHVEISITIIKHLPSLINVIPVVMSHHERIDGNGYPRGIKGENIPIEGRCLCIADAFDAMTTNRPYRKALSSAEAIEELKNHSGTQFDPKLVEIFIKIFKEGKFEMQAQNEII